jgi:transposase
VRDANALLDMLRLDLVPEAWIAPPAVRELRELIRYRAKLVMLRAGLKSQVQSVLTKEGVSAGRYELWSAKGRRHLDELALGATYRCRVDSVCRLINAYGREISVLSTEIDGWLADDVG